MYDEPINDFVTCTLYRIYDTPNDIIHITSDDNNVIHAYSYTSDSTSIPIVFDGAKYLYIPSIMSEISNYPFIYVEDYDNPIPLTIKNSFYPTYYLANNNQIINKNKKCLFITSFSSVPNDGDSVKIGGANLLNDEELASDEINISRNNSYFLLTTIHSNETTYYFTSTASGGLKANHLDNVYDLDNHKDISIISENTFVCSNTNDLLLQIKAPRTSDVTISNILVSKNK